MAFTETLLALVTVLVLIFIWCKRTFSYWKRNNVPYLEPVPFIGNTSVIFSMENTVGLHLADIYKDPKFANEAVVGIYSLYQPALLVRDPALIKSVLVKDFNKFSNRNLSANKEYDALAYYNLFFVKNPHWKELRNKLTPLFTSGKLKQMYPLVLEIAHELEKHLDNFEKVENSFITDVKEICTKFTTDVIASISFGIRANSLINPEADFQKYGRMLFDFNVKRAFHAFIILFMPKLISLFRAQIFPTEFQNYLRETFSHVMDEREKSGYKRNDLIDVLLALKKEAEHEKDGIFNYAKINDFLLAQATIFLIAGFETSSTTMSSALYELSKQPQLQKRLRAEIHDALMAANGDISYETVQSLEYLGMVLDETLRLYPVLPFLDRLHEYRKGEEEYTLKPFYDYTLPNGLPVFISVYGIQRDPKYWPDPNHFDPERFSKENKKYIDPMTYLPFGRGPHNCIGGRIGLLQVKIGLVYFLKNHFVESCGINTEVEFDAKSYSLASNKDLNMRVVNDRMYDANNNSQFKL